MKIKLTVIGGGSVLWMKGLMSDVYMIEEIEGGEIRLFDPNAEHVEAVAEMLKQFNKIGNKDYEIIVEQNRKKALEGADFVMTTFSPGSMDAFYNDLEIPITYGIRQPVSMTVGPCGISAAIRTVPVAYELVDEMESVCPGAWLLNVTNPMTTVTRAMNMAAKTVKVLGICHEFHNLYNYIGPMLGLHKPEGMHIMEYLYDYLEKKGFTYKVAGLNHFIWLTEAKYKGEDAYPQIKKYCEDNWEINQEQNEEHIQATSVYSNKYAAKLAMCRQFGYLPVAGDRHLVEFYPSLCNIQNGFGMKYGIPKTTVDFRRFEKSRQFESIKNIAAGEQYKFEASGEELAEIIRSVVTHGQTTAILNLPNKGQISNLPRDIVVETLANVTNEGVTAKPSGELPKAISSLCRLHADIQELTVEAALEGSREKVLKAICLDPMSGGADFSELPKMTDALLKENQKWLPRFFENHKYNK